MLHPGALSYVAAIDPSPSLELPVEDGFSLCPRLGAGHRFKLRCFHVSLHVIAQRDSSPAGIRNPQDG